MSYSEYIDMFKKVQKKDCPYRAFMFDVVGSKVQEEYINDHMKFINCVYSFPDLLKEEEKITNTKILLEDKFNKPAITHYLFAEGMNQNLFNPIILGDMITYFVHNNSITTTRMLELFSDQLKKYDINYLFHFNTGVYETNDYSEGSEKLFKGYMPQILENISKNTQSIVSKHGFYIDQDHYL